MARTIGGTIAGVVAWFVVIMGIGFLIRATMPALAEALNAHATTVSLIERLVISFAGSIAGGSLAASIAGRGSWAPLAAGVVLLAGFGYYHVTMIWDQFPVWYHLTFFVSLPLLSYLGGRLRGS
jgi:hypothetical protein